MTKEELKQKAEAEADKVIIGSGMDRTSVIHLKHLLVTMYLQGAEPREKQIAELEHQLTHRNCLDCSNHSSKLRMRNLELEKENAELKETLRTYNGCGDWDNDFHTCRVYLQREELQKCVEHLTKAKEIIKELVRVEYADFTNGDYSNELSKVLEQAEQFLKETE